jgi:hypothetical protein
MRLVIGRVYAVSPIESPNAPSAAALARRARPFGSTSTTPCRRARFDLALTSDHFPREVFFFGLGFAWTSFPAAAARAFCFFVATSTPTSQDKRTNTNDRPAQKTRSPRPAASRGLRGTCYRSSPDAGNHLNPGPPGRMGDCRSGGDHRLSARNQTRQPPRHRLGSRRLPLHDPRATDLHPPLHPPAWKPKTVVRH